MDDFMRWDFTFGQVSNIEIKFGNELALEILFPAKDSHGKKVAKKEKIIFHDLLAVKFEVKASPWVEIVAPIEAKKPNNIIIKRLGFDNLDQDSSENSYIYEVVTDGGSIYILAGRFENKTLETFQRGEC